MNEKVCGCEFSRWRKLCKQLEQFPQSILMPGLDIYQFSPSPSVPVGWQNTAGFV